MQKRDMGDLDDATGLATGMAVIAVVAIFLGLLIWSCRMLWLHFTGTPE